MIAAITALLFTGGALAQEAAGTWTKKSHAIKGSWKIANSQITLTDFSTKKAPDLKIFLSPLTVGELKNKNALKGAKLISKLKSHKGTQTYAIPKGVDLSQYKTVIIHCEKYTKLWGASALK
ncbi:MAG: DM13 domain-containing protein [Verrucomicrobiota bacterium]